MDTTNDKLKRNIELSLQIVLPYYENFTESKKLVSDAKHDEERKKDAAREAKRASVRATTVRKNAQALAEKDHATLITALTKTQELYDDPQAIELLKRVMREKMPLAFANNSKPSEPKPSTGQPKTEPQAVKTTPSADTKAVAPAPASAPKPSGTTPQSVHTAPANMLKPKVEPSKTQIGHSAATNGVKPKPDAAKSSNDTKSNDNPFKDVFK